MELEYKWDLPEVRTIERMLICIGQDATAIDSHAIRMQATYYDTPSGDVYRMHGGLRMRRENDESVCCLKLETPSDDACKARQEYEVGATDIREGLRLLKDAGAPADVCDSLAAQELVEICATDFMRREYDMAADGFTAKLAIDEGSMSRQGKSAPIAEIELEFVEGSKDEFHRFAQRLQEEYGLAVQPKSKLARAATL